MTLTVWQDWVAWGGIVLPLITLAWSAWQYVALQKRNEQQQRFDNFFRVMDKIGEPGGSIAAKAAAVYELRNYPEYSEVIARFCLEAVRYVSGDSAQILQAELRLTAAYFRDAADE
ncbi:hypothetical protein [Sphingobium sp.]|uniref:hypothetical protein n=1 Tax=Sphingobium sp. TaxID=1912891 RepID=UPI003BB65EE3